MNDDGPPSNEHSPYLHSMIALLQERGHLVSVVLPNTQRSWIGKAHFPNQVLTPTYFRPGTLHQDDGTVNETPLKPGEQGEEWVLIDGTPAACVHLGLWHFYQDRGPVDLVLSGPNHGRNSSTLYQMASGTIGGAMEAANFKRKAVALSFAFSSRDIDPPAIAAASRQALKVIDHLYHNWGSDVEVYSINVPVRIDVEQTKAMFTYSLENYWTASAFQVVGATTASGGHAEISGNTTEPRPDSEMPVTFPRHQHCQFKFTPRFGDVRQSVAQSEPGNDGLAVEQGMTRYTHVPTLLRLSFSPCLTVTPGSITPLRAKFMEAKSHEIGELKL